MVILHTSLHHRIELLVQVSDKQLREDMKLWWILSIAAHIQRTGMALGPNQDLETMLVGFFGKEEYSKEIQLFWLNCEQMTGCNNADTLLRRQAGQACLSWLGIHLGPYDVVRLGRFFILLQASLISFSHSKGFRLPSYKPRCSIFLYLIITSFYFLWQSQHHRCHLIIQPLFLWHGDVHSSQIETAIAVS